MADKIVILEDENGNNIYPITRGLAANSVDTNAIQDGAVTSSKIDSATYTTTEKRVGTWINGKPLYRKVVDTLTGTGGNNTFNLTTVLDANIDRCYHLDAVIWSSTSTGLIPPYNTSSQDYFRAFVGGSNVLTLSLGSVYTSTVQFRCVFYYTKTTD